MKTVIGLEALKDEFRRAKLQCGDLRGLKNKFALSEQLNQGLLMGSGINIHDGKEQKQILFISYN